MKDTTFYNFWIQWSSVWYNTATASCDSNKAEKKQVSDLCTIKDNCISSLFDSYIEVRDFVKKCYFRDPKKRLSKYKRAAVIAYVILLNNPLKYKHPTHDGIDVYYLKQNLAFYMGICSIIQDFTKEEIERVLESSDKLFDFSELGKADSSEEDDDFLTSVYKDLFFSECYHNFNFLSLANVFGLVTERASRIGSLIEERYKKNQKI